MFWKSNPHNTKLLNIPGRILPMAIYVSFSPIGVFASDEKGKELGFIQFGRDPKDAAYSMQACMKPELSKEEKELVEKLASKDIVFEHKKEGYTHEFPNPAGEYLRANISSLAERHNCAKSQKELNAFIHAVNFELTKMAMRQEFVDDKLIVHAVNALDELDRTTNTLAMRLREWYGLYYPEAGYNLPDNKVFAEYVSEKLYRSEVRGADPLESAGADIKKEDLEEIRAFAKKTLENFETKNAIEKYVDAKAKEACPNAYAVVGGMMCARLLAHAGSLERLAKFPASTIQILGAERAFFRFRHGGGASPKHGVIFGSKYMQSAPFEKKGKIARILAAKLSLAFKLDFYKGEFQGNKLAKSVESALLGAKKR